jgi:IS4 transposase
MYFSIPSFLPLLLNITYRKFQIRRHLTRDVTLGPAQGVSSSGRIRVLATSLDQSMASMAQLADLHHGRWRIEEAFKRLKHRLGLESVSGLSQHALLVDVATKVRADNLATLLNRSVIAARASR